MENQSLQLIDMHITPEMRAKAMTQAKNDIAERNVAYLPTLKLKNLSGDAVDGVKEGEYYVTFQEKDADGNSKTVTIPVGTRTPTGRKNADNTDETTYTGPTVIFLKRLYAYSWFREKTQQKEGRLLAWSNEIEAFADLKPNGDKQTVVLVQNPDGAESPMIEYEGNYRGFKEHKDAHYLDREGRNLLKFRNVLYAYLDVPGTDKKVFRFFVSNAGVTGVKDGAATGDYKNPEDGSLLQFIDSVRGSEHGVLFGTKCTLSSRYHTGGGTVPYYLPKFANAGPFEGIEAMADLSIQLEAFLGLKFEQDFGSLPRVGEKSVHTVTAKATPAGETVAFDDLPDAA